MGFLAKLASFIIKGVALAAGLGPLLGPLLGSSKAGQAVATGINDFNAIGSVIVQMEVALEGKTGADKLAAAIPLVKSIVLTSEMVSGKKIANDAKFTLGIQELTQGIYDIIESIHEDAVKTA